MAKEKKEIGWKIKTYKTRKEHPCCAGDIVYKTCKELEVLFFESPESKEERGEDFWLLVPVYKNEVKNPQIIK